MVVPPLRTDLRDPACRWQTVFTAVAAVAAEIYAEHHQVQHSSNNSDL